MITIEQLKLKLFSKARKGTTCPCCEQFVKIYKRQINSTAAKDLIRLYHYSGKFLHTKIFTEQGGGDFTKLKHWGLIEEMQNDDTSKKSSGFWKITELGKLFVEGKVEVPKYLHFYNGRVLEKSEETVKIKHSLKNKFNYEALMFPPS